MFQNESNLDIGDNSGAKSARVIRCLGGSNRRFSGIGDLVIVTIKKAIPHANVKKSQMALALIVTSRKGMIRSDGSYIRFKKNYAILLKKEDKKPIGTIISAPILREFGEWGYKELLSMAKKVI